MQALFGYGFRPFFLAAGVLAALYVPWWAGSLTLGWPLASSWPPTLWHAHEMLYGFIAAALAGFLLTAVPSWTGERGYAGRPLIALTVLWLAARLAILVPAAPALVVALLDVAFLPALALLLLPPLTRARNRNTPLLGVLALLAVANLVFHVALATRQAPLAHRALLGGIDVVLVLVTLIGGRIVPAFSSGALRAAGVAPHRPLPYVTPLAVGLMAANALADVCAAPAALAAGVAALAALVQAARLVAWRGLATRREPLVWVLHLAYAWLPAGLALKAVALSAGSAYAAFWLHALTIGAASTMIVAVMSRAALGHTGRPLVAAPWTVAAYGLLIAAALVRTLGLGLAGLRYPEVLALSGGLFGAAFVLYLVVYAPILATPRADGRPG